MTREEKIYLICCLLYDVRLNWDDDCYERVDFAKFLCLESELMDNFDFKLLADSCEEFLGMIRKDEPIDGRFFRREFPFGYQGMDKLYDLSPILNDRSKQFQYYVNQYITCPDLIFQDVERVMI